MTRDQLRPFQLLPALILVFIFQLPLLQAQSFEEGLERYRQKEYREAVSIFNTIRNPEAYLFTAKSFYALGQYQQANANLNNIGEGAPRAIYDEKLYTSALTDFQLKQFDTALNKLYQVFNQDGSTPLGRDANSLYRQILNYLTAGQRMQIIEKISTDEIKFRLLQTAMGKISYEDARQLFRASRSSISNDELLDKISDIEPALSNPSRYRSEYGRPDNRFRAPEGTIYNIGVALPAYQPDAREFDIVRSIYFGALLAARSFNRQNNNIKASFRFIDTGTSTRSLRSSVEQFSKNRMGDAIIGPLFSRQAEPMVPLSTDLKIPTIAPLANSNLNATGSYLFQTNPTFGMHGKAMAQYAVQELNIQRLAVIASRGSSGATSAEAFRDEAERLGAEISYYFVEDLQANEYQLSEYTRYFGSKEKAVEAVYAPLTGNTSLTLIDLMLNDIRRMDRKPVILGSQEWQGLNFASSKYNGLTIYFSQGYFPQEQQLSFRRFKNDYRNAFNDEPNQFAMIGYDIATFLLNGLSHVGNPAILKYRINHQPAFNGVVNNILFGEDNTNDAVKIIEVSETGELLIR